jgi:predicted SprT family Zn-dependent metalloprotease
MELKDIVAECKRLANEFCVEFTLPVRINNRLTRTLGRVCFECGRPYVMEISGPMLKTCTEESIIEVVRHEWAHWYAWKTDGEVHGHDTLFKEICKKIGCTHDKSKNKVEPTEVTKTWDTSGLSEQNKVIFNAALQLNNDFTVDDIVERTSLDVGSVIGGLTELEIFGFVSSTCGGRYRVNN